MKLFVLAGGFGTRLKTVISNAPKALAPVGDVPFLQIQIENWLAQGLRKFTFLLHHRSEQIIEFLEARKSDILSGCQVDWIIEFKPMDTGGAIANAVKELNPQQDFIVANADTWLGSGIEKMIYSSAPAMAVVKLPDGGRYGQVEFDDHQVVRFFVEKQTNGCDCWVNAGLYRLPPALFHDWNGRPFSLERKLLSNLAANHNLKAELLHTDFIDIGIPEDYNRFCNWIAGRRREPL